MKIHLKDDMAYLWGDWIAANMNYKNIDSLSGLLDNIHARGIKTLDIDCAHLNSIDASGAQYLKIWLSCLKLRGVAYELINIAGKKEESPLDSEQLVQNTFYNPFERKYLTMNRSKRRQLYENGRNQGYRPAASH